MISKEFMEFDQPMVVCFYNFHYPYHINVQFINFMMFGTLSHSSLKVDSAVDSAAGYHWNDHDIACQLTLE